MNKYLSIFFWVLITTANVSMSQTKEPPKQDREVWICYWDTSTNLSGYKDLHGNIKIPTRFWYCSGVFNNIAAVFDSTSSYFLLKDGRVVGKDSVYSIAPSEGEMDGIESEGKIAFHDNKTDKVGFFDSTGKVIIPTTYDIAYPFHNGVTIVKKGGKRKQFDLEHRGFVGGKWILINYKNETLIENWDDGNNQIDWYSMTTDKVADTANYISVKGMNGTRYSFFCYNKEFEHWFYNVFLPIINTGNNDKIYNLLFPSVTAWTDHWVASPRAQFLKKYSPKLKSKFNHIPGKNIYILHEDPDPELSESPLFAHFYTPGGEAFKEHYPAFDVIQTYNKPDGSIHYQDNLEFIRTDDGYKLYRVSIR